ncbi:MAG: cyclic nucleotide-binding domain-containing protein [Desulfocapsaceae bacterium]|jgi:CRP-like cAMP-binding protein|nr:cyclic nucleotide-binding domain-containing protein [Desulfocapsaceae bacterium]
MTSSTTTTEHLNQERSRLSSDFNLLRQSPVFSGIHHDVIKLFAYLSTRRSFKAGDYLIEQGKKANLAFVLVSGSVEITVHHRDREIVLQQLPPGSVFGELALLAQFKWFFNARAVNGAEVIIIDQTAFQKVIEKFPEQKDKLIERVIQIRVSRLENQTTFMLDQLLSTGETPSEAII